MKPYTIEIVVPKRKRFHVLRFYYWRIRAINGQILLSSKKYHNFEDVEDIAKKFGLACAISVVVISQAVET